MSRNCGFGEFKATSKASTNWPGIPQKISGGFTISTIKRGIVVPFPRERIVQNWEVLELRSRQYRLRPGSWADRFWRLISMPMDQ